MPGKERKWNHTNCSFKTTKGKEQKAKLGAKEQGQQIENSNEYGRY